MNKQRDHAENVLAGMALLAHCPQQAMIDVALAYQVTGISATAERHLTQAARKRLFLALQKASMRKYKIL